MISSAPFSSERVGTAQRTCVYCLQNEEIKEEQILLRGEHLYLCAPRGQLVEGYLAISPYLCTGSLSQLPAEYFEELARLKSIAAAFYDQAYGVTRSIMYEQGRGGGGARIDRAGGFPLHAHLCCLPAAVDLHGILAAKYVELAVRGLEELPTAVNNRPYVYVEGPDSAGAYRPAVYVAKSSDGDADVEQERLKPALAAALNMPERGDWRAYPGDMELSCVIERFAAFKRDLYWKENSNVRAAG